jgi:hypothetical protein
MMSPTSPRWTPSGLTMTSVLSKIISPKNEIGVEFVTALADLYPQISADHRLLK